MKHKRPDYNRIQDPAGLIPADEPVFLLRGKDRAAPAAVRFWAEAALALGADGELTSLAYDQAAAMEAWQAEHGGGQVPDLPTSILLPCPFCAGAGENWHDTVWWVSCSSCSADGPVSDTEAAAAAAWNTRALTPAPTVPGGEKA